MIVIFRFLGDFSCFTTVIKIKVLQKHLFGIFAKGPLERKNFPKKNQISNKIQD